MALRYVSGDLFRTEAQTIVIPVNCKGIAGKGVALQAKQVYPSWYSAYVQSYQSGQLHIGRPLLHEIYGDRLLVSFPTKDDWRNPSQLSYIERGLVGLSRLEGRGIETIAFPKLGVGAGGLSWEQVRPLMERYLRQFMCEEVLIYV